MGTEFNLGVTRGCVVKASPGCFKPGKNPVPIGVGEGRSARVHKISPTLGFNARTVQPLVSRYIVCYPGPACSTVANANYFKKDK